MKTPKPKPFDVAYVKTVELESSGGEISIVRFGDGQIRVSYERSGVRLSVPLTAGDLRRIRVAADEVVLADHLAGLDS